jgi:hypothetical protein
MLVLHARLLQFGFLGYTSPQDEMGGRNFSSNVATHSAVAGNTSRRQWLWLRRNLLHFWQIDLIPIIDNNLLVNGRDPYETLTLFGNDKPNKPADVAPSTESGNEKS